MKRLIGILFVALALWSCHSSKESARWEDPIYARPPESSQGHPQGGQGSVSATGVRRSVIDVACSWIGVPYRYGGNTRSGVDCSGLVCAAFSEGASLKLPRTSSDQAKWCTSVSLNKAEPGDLIFFTNKRGGGRVNHVAIYLGDRRVVHSTSSRGVIISSLDEEYWSTHFHSCGRALK